MIIRKLLFACLITLSVAGTPATAQSMQEVIVKQLVDQGFTRISINTTFLGRVRIVATSAARSREIIFNPRTGEILRDYWDDLDGGGRVSPKIVSPFGGDSGGGDSGGGKSGGTSGSGSSSGDVGHDDNDGDHDGDDDAGGDDGDDDHGDGDQGDDDHDDVGGDDGGDDDGDDD